MRNLRAVYPACKFSFIPYIRGVSVHLLPSMQLSSAINTLQHWASRGRAVFTLGDLAILFPDESARGLAKSLDRLTKSGLLVRACRGIYVNPHALPPDGYTLERLALALRRGEYNYLSLESMLSEYGAISQIPLDRITVMTTGRKGEYRTSWGVIEFTHTARSLADILANTRHTAARPLRMATLQAAWRDLKRVGRNTHLVDTRELVDA